MNLCIVDAGMETSRRSLLIGVALGALALAGWLPASCGKEPEKRRSGITGKNPPQRPPGTPKPPLDEDIAPVLARLDAWYSKHLPSDRYAFNAPATDAQLDKFERSVGIELTPSYRQLYHWHDGENDDRFGHIYGLPILPLAQAEFQWKAWQKVLAYFKGDRYEIRGGAWPEGAVDPAYINSRWLPLTHDGAGNHIGLDFDPWPRGRIGQVIIFGRDQEVKAVIAESLGKFLELVASLLESGNFRFDVAPGEMVLREFRLKSPPEHDFQDGVRILLGAPHPFA